MSKEIDEVKKDEFVDAFLGSYNKLRDAIDARVKDVTLADLPETVRDQLAKNVDTKIILAEMLTTQLAELEAANPKYVAELQIASDDYRVIMGQESTRRDQWREDRRIATQKAASGIE